MANFSGIAHIGGAISQTRKYSQEDYVAFRYITLAPLIGLLRHKLQKKKVTDTTFKMFEDRYEQNTGATSAATITTSTTSLTVTGASNYLQPGDILYFPAQQANNTNTTTPVNGENMLVTNVSGTTVTVIRANGAGDVSTNVTSTSAALSFQIIGNANREGSAERIAKSHDLESKYNYIQDFKWTAGVSEMETYRDGFGPDTLTRYKDLITKKAMMELENAFLFSQRTKLTEDGREKLITGGLTWFLNQTDSDAGTAAWATGTDLVTGDGTSRVWKVGADWTKNTWLKFIERSYRYGNKRKLAIPGESFMRYLQGLYSDQIRFPFETTKMGQRIATFDFEGYTMDFLRDPAMDANHPMDLLLVDTEFLKYGYFGKDMEMRKLPATSAEEEKWELRSWCGLYANNQLAHSWLTGMNSNVIL